MDHVREQLAKALREGEMAKLDRAELVNKLTRNLEESQSRNQQLLESGELERQIVLINITSPHLNLL